MIDYGRDKRQDFGVDKLRGNGGRGAYQYPTGFGKTTTAFKAVKRFNPDKVVHVVVPTIPLKEQWDAQKQQVLNTVEVFVVNTYITEPRQCDFLILDEAHRYSNVDAHLFSTVIDNCTCPNVMCLSASYTADQLLFLASKGIPLIDSISLEEAVANGWVSPFITYNLGLNFTGTELEIYEKASNIMKSHSPYFDGLNPFTALKDKAALKVHCQENGHDYNNICMRITRYNTFSQVRKATIYGAENKVKIIPQILNIVKGQIIIFSETQKYANAVHDLIGKEAVIYHSKLKKEAKLKALEAIKSGKARVICTAKALDEGLDVPNLSCGVVASGTSTERQNIQRTGRAVRFKEGKKAIMINLYIKDSNEISWLKKRQQKLSTVRWINDLSEIEINE